MWDNTYYADAKPSAHLTFFRFLVCKGSCSYRQTCNHKNDWNATAERKHNTTVRNIQQIVDTIAGIQVIHSAGKQWAEKKLQWDSRKARERQGPSECVCLKLKRKEVHDAGGSMTIARCNVSCVADLLLQTAFKKHTREDRWCCARWNWIKSETY